MNCVVIRLVFVYTPQPTTDYYRKLRKLPIDYYPLIYPDHLDLEKAKKPATFSLFCKKT